LGDSTIPRRYTFGYVCSIRSVYFVVGGVVLFIVCDVQFYICYFYVIHIFLHSSIRFFIVVVVYILLIRTFRSVHAFWSVRFARWIPTFFVRLRYRRCFVGDYVCWFLRFLPVRSFFFPFVRCCLRSFSRSLRSDFLFCYHVLISIFFFFSFCVFYPIYLTTCRSFPTVYVLHRFAFTFALFVYVVLIPDSYHVCSVTFCDHSFASFWASGIRSRSTPFISFSSFVTFIYFLTVFFFFLLRCLRFPLVAFFTLICFIVPTVTTQTHTGFRSLPVLVLVPTLLSFTVRLRSWSFTDSVLLVVAGRFGSVRLRLRFALLRLLPFLPTFVLPRLRSGRLFYVWFCLHCTFTFTFVYSLLRFGPVVYVPRCSRLFPGPIFDLIFFTLRLLIYVVGSDFVRFFFRFRFDFALPRFLIVYVFFAVRSFCCSVSFVCSSLVVLRCSFTLFHSVHVRCCVYVDSGRFAFTSFSLVCSDSTGRLHSHWVYRFDLSWFVAISFVVRSLPFYDFVHVSVTFIFCSDRLFDFLRIVRYVRFCIRCCRSPFVHHSFYVFWSFFLLPICLRCCCCSICYICSHVVRSLVDGRYITVHSFSIRTLIPITFLGTLFWWGDSFTRSRILILGPSALLFPLSVIHVYVYVILFLICRYLLLFLCSVVEYLFDRYSSDLTSFAFGLPPTDLFYVFFFFFFYVPGVFCCVFLYIPGLDFAFTFSVCCLFVFFFLFVSFAFLVPTSTFAFLTSLPFPLFLPFSDFLRYIHIPTLRCLFWFVYSLFVLVRPHLHHVVPLVRFHVYVLLVLWSFVRFRLISLTSSTFFLRYVCVVCSIWCVFVCCVCTLFALSVLIRCSRWFFFVLFRPVTCVFSYRSVFIFFTVLNSTVLDFFFSVRCSYRFLVCSIFFRPTFIPSWVISHLRSIPCVLIVYVWIHFVVVVTFSFVFVSTRWFTLFRYFWFYRYDWFGFLPSTICYVVDPHIFCIVSFYDLFCFVFCPFVFLHWFFWWSRLFSLFVTFCDSFAFPFDLLRCSFVCISFGVRYDPVVRCIWYVFYIPIWCCSLIFSFCVPLFDFGTLFAVSFVFATLILIYVVVVHIRYIRFFFFVFFCCLRVRTFTLILFARYRFILIYSRMWCLRCAFLRFDFWYVVPVRWSDLLFVYIPLIPILILFSFYDSVASQCLGTFWSFVFRLWILHTGSVGLHTRYTRTHTHAHGWLDYWFTHVARTHGYAHTHRTFTVCSHSVRLHTLGYQFHAHGWSGSHYTHARYARFCTFADRLQFGWLPVRGLLHCVFRSFCVLRLPRLTLLFCVHSFWSFSLRSFWLHPAPWFLRFWFCPPPRIWIGWIGPLDFAFFFFFFFFFTYVVCAFSSSFSFVAFVHSVLICCSRSFLIWLQFILGFARLIRFALFVLSLLICCLRYVRLHVVRFARSRLPLRIYPSFWVLDYVTLRSDRSFAVDSFAFTLVARCDWFSSPRSDRLHVVVYVYVLILFFCVRSGFAFCTLRVSWSARSVLRILHTRGSGYLPFCVFTHLHVQLDLSLDSDSVVPCVRCVRFAFVL